MNQNRHLFANSYGLCHLVFFDEDLYNQHIDRVRETIMRILTNGFREGHMIEIHFGNIHKLDNGVIGVIMSATGPAREKGDGIQLVTTNTYVEEKFRTLGIESMFDGIFGPGWF